MTFFKAPSFLLLPTSAQILWNASLKPHRQSQNSERRVQGIDFLAAIKMERLNNEIALTKMTNNRALVSCFVLVADTEMGRLLLLLGVCKVFDIIPFELNH